MFTRKTYGFESTVNPHGIKRSVYVSDLSLQGLCDILKQCSFNTLLPKSREKVHYSHAWYICLLQNTYYVLTLFGNRWAGKLHIRNLAASWMMTGEYVNQQSMTACYEPRPICSEYWNPKEIGRKSQKPTVLVFAITNIENSSQEVSNHFTFWLRKIVEFSEWTEAQKHYAFSGYCNFQNNFGGKTERLPQR